MNMLHSIEGLQGFSISALDGELGHVKDLLFDDREWTIRHLIVDTGSWLTGRKVLISPAAIQYTDWDNKTLAVRLSRQQVQDSPDVDSAKPVSRQQETALYDYYGYPYYWNGPYLWGYSTIPAVLEQRTINDMSREAAQEQAKREASRADPHLRSCDEVIGYDIQASDDAIGHVDDFLFNDENWRIELMVVDTRNWWPGKHVMISPQRITRVSWETKMVEVDVTRDQVENSPEFDASHPPPAGQSGLFRQAAGWR